MTKKKKKTKNGWNTNTFKIKTKNVEYKIKEFEMEFGFADLMDIENPKELLEPNIELKRFSIDFEIKKPKTKSRKKLTK